MTRFIHDQFAKQYLEELLSPFGTVETGKTIAAEVQEVDVLFIANPESNQDRSSLGLLGEIAGIQTIFEPFRNAVQPKQIRSCLGKLYAIQSNEERKANRDNVDFNSHRLYQPLRLFWCNRRPSNRSHGSLFFG